MALVVSQQLHSCWRLRMLQGCVGVQRLLGWKQSCLVDCWGRHLQWTCWSKWAFWLWRAILELRRHHSCVSKRALAHAHAQACACASTYADPYAIANAFSHAITDASAISAYTGL